MRVVADENIPDAVEAFGQFGPVTVLPGRAISHGDLAGADALIVRSVTHVGRDLLAGTPVRFVGTATIGTDHLDLEWLQQAGIVTADAAGCNSRSVAEYVIAALFELEDRRAVHLPGSSLGIIGVGRIGSLVGELARALGMSVVEYDPPRERRDSLFRSAPIGAALACDIVSVHVPLTDGGEHPTAGMIDGRFLSSIRPGAVVVNTSRGGVARNAALEAFARNRGRIVIDVWDGEPDVPVELIGCAAVATPHIAGYSLEGKLRGTWMMAESLARFSGGENRWSPRKPKESPVLESLSGEAPHVLARRAVRATYDIVRDDEALRALVGRSDAERRIGFDRLRREYPDRREFGDCVVRGVSPGAASVLAGLGFRVIG